MYFEVNNYIAQTIQKSEHDVILLDFYSIFQYLDQCLGLIDFFVWVTCDQETQYQRLINQRKIEPELAQKRIQSQLKSDPLEVLRNRVNFTIENNQQQNTESQIQSIITQMFDK